MRSSRPSSPSAACAEGLGPLAPHPPGYWQKLEAEVEAAATQERDTLRRRYEELAEADEKRFLEEVRGRWGGAEEGSLFCR